MSSHSDSPLRELPSFCPVCGNTAFTRQAVLWDALVAEWELTPQQRSYIDDQQGLECNTCKSNLRSMTLASAILRELNINETFVDACGGNATLRGLRVLEINEAGNLSDYLCQLPRHFLASYPHYDMQHLAFSNASFDIVIHSDTLEHVPDSVRALSECRRVIAPGGFLAYTIPIIPDRLTKHRNASVPSYHGNEANRKDDFIVYREYGGDFWREFFEAGFSNILIHSLVYPASVALIGYNFALDI